MNISRFDGCRRAFAVGTAAAVLLVAPGAAFAGSNDADMARDGGLGAGSALCSLLYGPVKILYATGGILTGALAFGFSGGDVDVARSILTPSVLGDYVVTTEHLRGQRKLEFIGRAAEPSQPSWESSAPTDVAAAPDGW